ncbi:MAG: beta-mannanase [Bacteroidota bacterium]
MHRAFLRLFLTGWVLGSLISCDQVIIDSYLSKWNKMDRVTVRDGQFLKGDAPYYFIGANYWYGPLIGSEALGDRERLLAELDLMKEKGIDNLRILVGAEGDGGDSRVHPALQPEQGVYNEDLLDGLDFLLMHMRKRDMYAILYMNNNWIWSGGMSQYLTWNGYGEVPNPFLEQYTWSEYMNYTAQFHTCEPCMEAYYSHVRFIMNRTNAYTGIKYTEDHTVMSWQVANEPRVFFPEHEPAFAAWLNKTVALMESIDSVHLISTGAEGSHSYLQDIRMFERLHVHPDIDYLTMHMWPKNWDWYDIEREKETLDSSMMKGLAYMSQHIAVADKLQKPIVMSEFGFPRAKESLSPMASVANRNTFYQFVIDQIQESRQTGGTLAGLNFWGFGGYAKTRPEDGKWQPGDDFSGDPPQEPQGLNTVFASDTSTLEMISKANFELTEVQ